jgi:hypothetical protein
MTNQRKKCAPFISLIYKQKYMTYDEFYDEHKTEIYKSILEIFKKFKTTRKKSLCLYLSAKIQSVDWDTEFHFHKDESIVLKRDLMPYFEKIEDYETCDEIKNLYKELT